MIKRALGSVNTKCPDLRISKRKLEAAIDFLKAENSNYKEIKIDLEKLNNLHDKEDVDYIDYPHEIVHLKHVMI